MPKTVPGSWRGVVNRYRACSDETQAYFPNLPDLIETYDWEVPLSFMFARTERAHNVLLYRGTVKLHRADPSVARNFVEGHHMTRKEFRRLFKNVFGKALSRTLVKVVQDAEGVRDKVIHGKTASTKDKRMAIARLLEYAEGVNALVYDIAGFKAFTGDARGYTGRRKALEKDTTAWLMRGLGFTERAADDAEEI